MTDSLAHRGPDGRGFLVDGGIGLGHPRLSIIDLAGAQQPMYNEDRSVAVVYKGEIYTFNDLAADLRSAGHVIRRACYTVVTVHPLAVWGADCARRFRGLFAFAMWGIGRRSCWDR